MDYDHITTVCTKVSKNAGIIVKGRHNINKNTVLLLYHSLIQPYLDYCNIIWATGLVVLAITLKAVSKTKKALRAITFRKWNAHTNPLFAYLNILIVYDINKLQTLCFVYKAVNNLLPKHFNTFFNLFINIHQHDTIQSSGFHFTFHRTNIRANSIKILGPKLWNSFCSSITSLPSFHSFKNRCFKSILNSCVQ